MNKKGIINNNFLKGEIKGIGVAFPKNNGQWISNDDIHKILYGENWSLIMKNKNLDPDFISKKYGFKNRYWVHKPGAVFAKEELTSVDLMVKAAKNAFTDAKIKPSQIDLIISVTTTSPKYTTSTAMCVAEKLNMQCAGFEMKSGCSSLLFALNTAYLYLQNGANHILIVLGETISKVLNPSSTQIYAGGDGGAAIVLSKTNKKDKGMVVSYLNADGKYSKGMGVPGILPPTKNAVNKNEYYMHYDNSVEDFIKQKWKEIPSVLYRNSKIKPNDIDCLIPHQVNNEIIQLVAESAKINNNKVVNIVSQFANCGTISMVNAMHQAKKNKLLKADSTIMLASVGGGIAWGGAIINL